jgi:hypothetical protein
MLVDDDVKQMMVIVTVKILQDRLRMKMWRGSVIGRLCIPENSALGHATLMQDYFSKVLTYPPALLCRRF